jgi:hypothetical protein
LVVLLECGPRFWRHLEAGGLTPRSLAEQLLAFVRLFTLLNDNNKLILFTVDNHGCEPLYPSAAFSPAGTSQGGGNFGGSAIDSAPREILEGLQRLAHKHAQEPEAEGLPYTTTSCGLSRTLCFINKAKRAAQDRQERCAARLLCLFSTQDTAAQYIPFMNCIFAAQASLLCFYVACMSSSVLM